MSEGSESRAASSASDADLALAHRLADAAGAAIEPFFRRADLDVDDKSTSGASVFDPVTAADRAAESAMRRILERDAPSDGVLGEEFGRTDGASGRLWVLDPIDGTRGFIAGLTSWGVLIALHDGERAALGMLDQPYIGERFFARAGDDGATLLRSGDCRTLRTRACPSLDTASFVTTDPFLFRTATERRIYDAIAARARLKRFGTDCMGYAMVAGGWADLVIETGLSAYDIQALVPIVEAAGGVVTDWSGARDPWRGDIVAAGDPRLHREALALIAALGAGDADQDAAS